MNWMLATLLVAALITATISAIIGMGGGILLLAVIFCFLPHADAIPVHAVTQLASNSTRVVAYGGNIDWPVFRRFTVGALPGAVLGALLLWWLGQADQSEPYLKTAVGLYVLAAPFVPKGKNAPTHAGVWWDWPLLGLLAGTLALTVGAVGPLIAPLFARRDFLKERLIATKAACQMLTHLIKLPAFIILGGFALGELWSLALPMVALVVPGTLLGRYAQRYVSPELFRTLYRVALFVAGAKVLTVDGLYPLLRG